MSQNAKCNNVRNKTGICSLTYCPRSTEVKGDFEEYTVYCVNNPDSPVPNGIVEQAAVIRKYLKRACPNLKVQLARNSAYGWLTIYGSLNRDGAFTIREYSYLYNELRSKLNRLSWNRLNSGLNINPTERDYYCRVIIKEQRKLEQQQHPTCIRCLKDGMKCSVIESCDFKNCSCLKCSPDNILCIN